MKTKKTNYVSCLVITKMLPLHMQEMRAFALAAALDDGRTLNAFRKAGHFAA